MRWVTVAVGWFAASGAIATVLFNVVYGNVLRLVPAAATAAGLVGGALWWALVERGTVTWLRGAAVSLFLGFWGLVLAGWLTVFLGYLGAVSLVTIRERRRLMAMFPTSLTATPPRERAGCPR